MGEHTVLTWRFGEAVVYASRLHATQIRKGSGAPYVSHLLGTASIALEYGATEDEAIAALLHDAIEDQPRDGLTRMEIESTFGLAVLGIVEGCTDGEPDASGLKPPWRARKEAYVAGISSKAASTRLVSASDKLHNARTIVADLNAVGDDVWDRFTGRRDGTLWYYRALVVAFRAADISGEHSALITELDSTVTRMDELA